MKNTSDKNIYDMFNDIEIDLSEFEKEGFNDIEKMKIKKKFRKSIGKKNTKRYVSAASIALLTITAISFTPVGTYASKVISDLVFDIKSALRLGEEQNGYVEIINKSITKEGITVRANEAVLNDDELVISITTKSEDKIERDMRIWRDKGSKLYINGELIDGRETSTSTDASKNNIDEVMFFGIDSTKYEGKIDVKLELSDVIIYKKEESEKLTKEKVVEGPFIFEFTLDTTKINKTIKTIDINKTLKIDNDVQITLNRYTSTALAQKIHYTINQKGIDKNTRICLNGVDDLGNEVEFSIYAGANEKGQLISETEGKKVSKSAKYLKLKAYELVFVENKERMETILKEIPGEIKIELNK